MAKLKWNYSFSDEKAKDVQLAEAAILEHLKLQYYTSMKHLYDEIAKHEEINDKLSINHAVAKLFSENKIEFLQPYNDITSIGIMKKPKDWEGRTFIRRYIWGIIIPIFVSFIFGNILPNMFFKSSKQEPTNIEYKCAE